MSTFSSDWYSVFLDTIAPEQTEAEVAFISRCIPLASHPRILDVCCGVGRHANELARRGYNVIGVDTNVSVLERARAAAPEGATFLTLDMRELDKLPTQFDGVINLWSSFGYFDDLGNETVLRQMASKLRSRGRAVIDIYNRDHVTNLPAQEQNVRGGVNFTTRRAWAGNRMKVQLTYESGATDDFEWRVYSPAEFSELSTAAGLDIVHSCAWFVESLPASSEHARMQFVLERR